MDPGYRDHPDAHTGRGDRGARLRHQGIGPKVWYVFGSLPRKVPSVEAGSDKDTNRLAVWHEVFGIDSLYDYDPVWQKCVDVGIAPTSNGAAATRRCVPPTNFTYNHIGHFADAGHAAAKAFLGGDAALPGIALRVSRRRRRL